jgi:acetyltransferase-like isoleucine patch superfamily enzyme
LGREYEVIFKHAQGLRIIQAMEKRNSERETIVDTLSKKSQSSLKKYQQLFVGTDLIFDLLRYEFLTFFFAPMPGALGFFLRKVFYKKLFAKIGNGTVIGPYVTLRCPKQISLGNTVLIDSNTVLDAKGSDSHIQIGDSVLIGKDNILSCTSATIVIGDDVSIGPNCHIRAGLCPIEMGSHITIGSHTVVISGNPDYKLKDIPMKSRVGSTEGITIGRDVWIGVGVRIIDGTNIGNGCVIGAGAVVTESVPDYAIAAGVPARVIGDRNK